MSIARRNIDTLEDIRNIMERSSRFISLSGWSGISAGFFALAGTWFAARTIDTYKEGVNSQAACETCLEADLTVIAAVVFILAFISAIVFTYTKSKKEGAPFWGPAAKRLLWNTLLPMLIGGLVIWRMLDLNYYQLIVPSMLIFYGLALVNGSKYTMGEIRFLGYAEILTGIIALYLLPYGLYTWAFGFGILHIIYGVSMWWKYDRKNLSTNADQ